MIKQILLLLFIIVCTIWNSAKAQSYSVESFEGQKVKIHLIEKSSLKTWYSATIYCLTDSLILEDYNGIEEVRVLNHRFLEFVYSTRGGSGYQSKNTLILSVKGNKINVAILVNSFGKSFGGDIDGSLYNVKFGITGYDKSNFKLIAHIYDRHRSYLHPKENYIKNKQVVFNFDPNQNIFYSSHKSVLRSFIINTHESHQLEKWKINESLPVIILDGDTLYYIKGKWYNLGYDNTLFEEYFKNHL